MKPWAGCRANSRILSWREGTQVETGVFQRIREASLLERLGPWQRPALALGAFGVASLAFGLAWGKRKDRQTQIEALQHGGWAGAVRKQNTAFGSGWRGLDENSSSEHAGLLSAGMLGTYAAHKVALSRYGSYRQKLYDFASAVEDRSPRHVLRTLGLSQRASTYLADQLAVTEKDLWSIRGTSLGGGNLTQKTRLAEHLERVAPGLNLENYAGKTLDFRRLKANSPYLTLHADGEAQAYHVAFQKSGVWTDVGERFGAPHGSTHNSSIRGLSWHRGQDDELLFRPYLGKTDGKPLTRLWEQAKRETFVMNDRLNRMLEEFHWPGNRHLNLGLHPGEFNSSTELVTKLLTRRALPVAAGIAGLAYADYLLGHKPSNALFAIPAKARVAWAEATDRTPGGRRTTDWYAQHVPGPQYGPLALPVAGAFLGGLAHYGRILAGEHLLDDLRKPRARKYALAGAAIGGLLALPFVPGMLGSRKTADQLRSEYAGETPVPVRSGRWWTAGNNALSGQRILAWKPSWYALHTSRAEDASLYGSEEEKWAHNPLLHPIRWFKDPNWLADKHAADRPYPISSPAFSNVPLIGPLLAATIGRVVAPPKRLHEQEWDGSDYTLYTKAVEPKSPRALSPTHPHEEFDTHHLKHHAEEAFEEAIGLPGFLAKMVKGWFKSGKDEQPHVYFEGTRQMTSWARRYYERELGAIPAPHGEQGIAGYSEPIRRFLTRERDTPRVNEIPNSLANVSWIPGEESFQNFKKGDPFIKITGGYYRIPGAGYEALHPELKGVNPEDYPDIVKLRVLGDIAPFSLKYRQMARRVGKQAQSDKALQIEYQQILDRAEQTKESSVRFDRKHTGETEEITGTVQAAGADGLRLEEYPGQSFSFSSLGLSAADLSSYSLGQTNQDIAEDVTRREGERASYLGETLAPGTNVRLVLPKGASTVSRSQAVVFADGTNINKELLTRGYATVDLHEAGPETQAMDGPLGQLFRRYTEAVAFEGDEAWYNPLRYLPSSVHAKLWNERTALDQYLNQEVLGTKMRRWQRPVHDFLDPYLHSAAYRLTGRVAVPEETQEKRDLNTLADQLSYLRELYGSVDDPARRVDHLRAMRKTSIGANLFGETDTLPRTLSSTDRKYFSEFVRETNPEQRERIMASVSKEMADTLMAQWTKQANAVKRARGESVERYEASGRVVTQLDIDKITDFEGKVVKVIDGDSLLVRTEDGDKEVRLANINSREIPSKQGFTDKDMTTQLALGRHVRAHEIGRDKYDRHVSDVFFDDKSLLNYELLQSGHAHKDVYENHDNTNQDKLSVGDYFRARDIAEFFQRRGLKLPEAHSEILADDIDYEDVKVKIVQWEGQNLHDFGIFDDRAHMLWRKPYLDSAVRELTAGDDRSVDQTTAVIEQAIAESKKGGPKADVKAIRQASHQAVNTIQVNVTVDAERDLKQEVRRNREDYVQ